jgi:hypothetical protein
MEENNDKIKRNAMLIGAIGGALIGVVAARMFIRAAEAEAAETGKELSISPAKGLQIGVLVMGLLRQLSNL